MTFYRGFCDDVFDTLGRDATLRHAYRVYLWRRALGFVRHSPSNMGATAGAQRYSDIQAFPWRSKTPNDLDAELARRM